MEINLELQNRGRHVNSLLGWDHLAFLAPGPPPWISPGYLQFSCIRGFNFSSCYSNEPRCLTAHLCSQKKSNENTSWNLGMMFLKLFFPVFEVFSPPQLVLLLPHWGGFCNTSDFIPTWLQPCCPSCSPGCHLSLNPSSWTSLFSVTLPQSFECLKAFPLILFPSTTGISAPSASPQSFQLFDCSPVKTRSETTVSFWYFTIPVL